MLFQFVLTKFFKSEMFSCLQKVHHVIKSSKEPIVLSFPTNIKGIKDWVRRQRMFVWKDGSYK